MSCKDILFARQALMNMYPKWAGTSNDLKAAVEQEIFNGSLKLFKEWLTKASTTQKL